MLKFYLKWNPQEKEQELDLFRKEFYVVLFEFNLLTLPGLKAKTSI